VTAPARVRTPRKGRRAPEAAEPSAVPIRTRSLTKEYGSLVAVDGLDLDVRAGEIFGLLGQNGAGKTTTILMLLGLTEPTSGTARVVGLDPSRRPLEVKRRVGYLPDAVGFYGGLTGRQNLRYTARLNGIPDRESEVRISEVLEQVNLADRADTRTDTYSRGMLQRLGIADALVKDPDVLILDEPTTSIDPIGVAEILDVFRALAHERGLAVLLSSHLLNQVQSTCDRIGIFAAGRLIGTGTVDQLATQFGFPLTDLELTLDVPADRVGAIEAVVRAVPGVLEVARDVSTPPERTWIITTDPERDVQATTRAVIAATGEEQLVRIGQRRVALDSIYRRAVERRTVVDRGAATA
jgi:ABC-2 type transport system ATP-binding protein